MSQESGDDAGIGVGGGGGRRRHFPVPEHSLSRALEGRVMARGSGRNGCFQVHDDDDDDEGEDDGEDEVAADAAAAAVHADAAPFVVLEPEGCW